jgi:glycosyltransferase involved in cell wall biosynthesis
VILNDNAMNRALLGQAYPLYAADAAAAVSVIERALADPPLLEAAARSCARASCAHTFEAIARELAPELAPLRASRLADAVGAPHEVGRVTIAGHQLHFAQAVIAALDNSGVHVELDQWARHNAHDEQRSERALAHADTIICEWCLGNAVWYSGHVREDQRLLVRFHRSELTTDYPARVNAAAVAAFVFVAAHVADEAVERFRWPVERVHVLPNAIDAARFDRPKLPEAAFNLALIGWVPRLKRLDRALDVLEAVRLRDDRFRLIVKGGGPSSYAWMARRTEELEWYERLTERIAGSALLREAVTFEQAGADMPEFLQKTGYVLSVSDVEGHQVSVAEAMASGCIPVVIDRPGALDQYPAAWVARNATGAARIIIRSWDVGELERQRAAARAHAAAWSVDELLPRWLALIEGREASR